MAPWYTRSSLWSTRRRRFELSVFPVTWTVDLRPFWLEVVLLVTRATRNIYAEFEVSATFWSGLRGKNGQTGRWTEVRRWPRLNRNGGTSKLYCGMSTAKAKVLATLFKRYFRSIVYCLLYSLFYCILPVLHSEWVNEWMNEWMNEKA